MNWKLQKATKIGKLLELVLTNEEMVLNNFHLPLSTNHDHLINVVGILATKDEYINQITLIVEKR
jgi:hypothetical protein